ncbi:MAG: GYF domain-containing protein [Muribaculaceae bacterium]|nr:GYF domain-containing protein [Muribaculaceae bacterium]
MPTEYYIVVNDRQQGPLSKEDLRLHNINSETLVWRTGMQDWTKASQLPELADLFTVDVDINTTGSTENTPPDNGWYAMIFGNRVGPTTINDLINRGLQPDTPVWHQGLHDWVPASSQAEITLALNNKRPPHFNPYGQPDFSNNPQYGQPSLGNNPASGNNWQRPGFSNNQQYNNNNPYGQNRFTQNNQNPYPHVPTHTNWMPWAIAATIIGFLFSCIGAIFGIVAIVQSNKANEMFAAGFDESANSANNTAKTMTIIGFVLAGVGLVSSSFFWSHRNIADIFNYL